MQEEAVLRVVTSADQAPFEFFNSLTNSIEGFDIDLIKEVGRKLNMKIMIVDMDFGGILPSLQSGQADMAIAGITRTPEREKTIGFSIDYYQPQLAILSKTNNPIKNITDKNIRRIGAQLGTFHHALLEDASKTTNEFEVVARNRLLDLVQELLTDNIQAVIMDHTPATKFRSSNKQKLTLEKFKHPSAKAYAIALPQNSPLQDKINDAIRTLIKEGVIRKLENKWLSDNVTENK